MPLFGHDPVAGVSPRRSSQSSLILRRHVIKLARLRPTSTKAEGSGTGLAACWNRRNVGPPSVPLPGGGPLPAAMNVLMNAPVVPLNRSTSPPPKLATYRLPSGPKTNPRGKVRSLPGPTNALMNAPVVPLYFNTPPVTPELVAYRLPSGPNVTSRPPVRPPLPEETKISMNAPVVPLNRTTSTPFAT